MGTEMLLLHLPPHASSRLGCGHGYCSYTPLHALSRLGCAYRYCSYKPPHRRQDWAMGIATVPTLSHHRQDWRCGHRYCTCSYASSSSPGLGCEHRYCSYTPSFVVKIGLRAPILLVHLFMRRQDWAVGIATPIIPSSAAGALQTG
jgi:hypothetical protein